MNIGRRYNTCSLGHQQAQEQACDHPNNTHSQTDRAENCVEHKRRSKMTVETHFEPSSGTHITAKAKKKRRLLCDHHLPSSLVLTSTPLS